MTEQSPNSLEATDLDPAEGAYEPVEKEDTESPPEAEAPPEAPQLDPEPFSGADEEPVHPSRLPLGHRPAPAGPDYYKPLT